MEDLNILFTSSKSEDCKSTLCEAEPHCSTANNNTSESTEIMRVDVKKEAEGTRIKIKEDECDIKSQNESIDSTEADDLESTPEVDIKSLIRESVTLNLCDKERKLLKRFAKAFIQSAEEKSSKVPPKSTIDTFLKNGPAALITGATGAAVGLTAFFCPPAAAAAATATLFIKPLATAAAKPFTSVATEAMGDAQEDKRSKNHKAVQMKVKQLVLKGNQNEDESSTKIFRLFYTNFATDIFLRFKDEIHAWCLVNDKDCALIEEMGKYAGSRFYNKLTSVQDRKDILKEFVGTTKPKSWMKSFLKVVCPCCCMCCRSTASKKNEIPDFETIFLKPVPAVFMECDVRIKISDNEGNHKIKFKSKTKTDNVAMESLTHPLIRPPFEFEHQEMLKLLEREEEKLRLIDFESIFSSNSTNENAGTIDSVASKKYQFIWEDCTPLAIDIFEELIIDEDLDPNNALYHRITTFIQKENKRQRQLETIRQTKAAETAIVKDKRSQNFTSQPPALKQSTRSLSPKLTSTTSDPPVAHFVGRDDLLSTLHDKLKKCKAKTANESYAWEDKMVIVTGCGGFGKTEFVKKYALKYLSYHRNIVWIAAESLESLKNSFLDASIKWGISNQPENELLDQESIDSLVKSVYDHFLQLPDKLSKKCLFIFDNAQQMETDDLTGTFGIGPFLPKTIKNGHLPLFLVTSENSNWNLTNENITQISMPPLLPNEAMLLQRQSLDISRELDLNKHKNSGLRQAMTDLTNELAGLPLGIEIAAASILANVEGNKRQSVHFSIENKILDVNKMEQEIQVFTKRISSTGIASGSGFRASFWDLRGTLRSQGHGVSGSHTVASVKKENMMNKILNVTFASIKEKYKTMGKKALELFHVISYLATDSITAEACYSIYYPPSLHKANDSDKERSNAKLVQKFNALFEILNQYKLIKTEQKEDRSSRTLYTKVHVHRLVQTTTRQILKEDGFCLGKFLRCNTKTIDADTRKMYNVHSNKILDNLFATNCPNELALAACILTSNFFTQDPIHGRHVEKLENIFESGSKSTKMEMITIIDMFLKLYDWDCNASESESNTANNENENLVKLFTSNMCRYDSDVHIQFVGSTFYRQLLCDQTTNISCGAYKDIYAWSLHYLKKQWSTVGNLKDIWTLVFENIFEIFTKSKLLFMVGDSTDAVQLLVQNYSADSEWQALGYWSALLTAMHGSKTLPGFDFATTTKECNNLQH